MWGCTLEPSLNTVADHALGLVIFLDKPGKYYYPMIAPNWLDHYTTSPLYHISSHVVLEQIKHYEWYAGSTPFRESSELEI